MEAQGAPSRRTRAARRGRWKGSRSRSRTSTTPPGCAPPTARGSSPTHVPSADAALVAKARDAGAIVVGKTLTHEFAWGITSVNPHFPPCRNPYDPERVLRRLQRRLGGRAGDRPGGAGARHRHRRLDPHPRVVLRRVRAEADVRPAEHRGRLSARPLARPHRPDGAHAGGREAVLRGARGPRAGRAAPSAIAVCPDLHVRPLEPGIRRAFEHAVLCLDAEVRRARLRAPGAAAADLRDDPERRGRAHARVAVRGAPRGVRRGRRGAASTSRAR